MANHPDLDLKGSIRPGLDILANEIVIGLKKRTRFATNAAVYKPGLVIAHPDDSLLRYVLSRVEQSHAELGRYAFAAQDAFSDVSSIKSAIDRSAPASPVRAMSSDVGDKIIGFYCDWIDIHCEVGDSTDTYGETVTADVSVLLAMMERINLGRKVAEAKFTELTKEFVESNGDRDTMLSLIVRPDREREVIELSKQLALHYELTEAAAVSAFEFMIKATVDLEVDYLRMRIDQQKRKG